jgi:hypothetical protein
MSSTRIYHNVSKLPIASTVVLIFGNYEIYRIHKGTHPYWSPRLEAAGILKSRQRAESTTGKGAEGVKTDGADALRWTNLNGVPIPTLSAFASPFGTD